MSSVSPEIVPLFVTPLVILDVPESEALNTDFHRAIEQREKSHSTTHLGGWQSSWDMDRWDGAAAIKLWRSSATSPIA